GGLHHAAPPIREQPEGTADCIGPHFFLNGLPGGNPELLHGNPPAPPSSRNVPLPWRANVPTGDPARQKRRFNKLSCGNRKTRPQPRFALHVLAFQQVTPQYPRGTRQQPSQG